MKTKKSTILSIATAAAIVATTFGTYALWDTTTANVTANLTLRQPVAIAATTLNEFKTTDTFGSTPTYTSDVTFTVANKDQLSSENINLATKVKKTDGTDVTSNFTVAYAEKTGGAALTDGKDATIEASNVYTVTITPNDTDEAKALADGSTLSVEVTGTLAK